MSDENENSIDRSKGLSHEGAAIEAMLESAKLPPSKLNRDVLMYKAGWNAARAELGSSTESSVSARPQTIWPVLTAVFATTAAVLLLMVVQKQPTVDSGLSAVEVAVEEQSRELLEDEVSVAEESLKQRDVPKPATVFALFEFRPKATYRQRIENFLRDSHRQVTPVMLEGDFDDFDNGRLKTGSLLNVEELVDELL